MDAFRIPHPAHDVVDVWWSDLDQSSEQMQPSNVIPRERHPLENPDIVVVALHASRDLGEQIAGSLGVSLT